MVKKSGLKVPKVALDEIGPRMNWHLRRVKSANDEVKKQSMKQPRVQKKKNVERGTLGDKMGRVHMQSQETKTIALRKFKVLKKKRGKAEPSDSREPRTKKQKS